MHYNNDDIFSFFEKDSHNIIYKIYDSITDLTLYNDKKCKKKCVSNEFYNQCQVCKGCNIICSFTDKTKICKDTSILNINYGLYKNKKIIFERKKFNQSNVFYKKKIHNKDILYFTKNPELNLATINFFTKFITKKYNIILNNFVWSYICNNHIAYIYIIEKDIYQNFKINMIDNLLDKLYILNKFNYSHGEPYISYLKYTNELYLYNSIYSSISFNKNNNNHKIYYKQYEPYLLSHTVIEKKNYIIGYINEKNVDIVECYIIGNKQDVFLSKYRQGLCSHYKSFDFICFFISLLLNKSFYKNFVDSYYFKYWKRLWNVFEYKNLESDIVKFNKKNTFENVYDIVKNYSIRYDAFNYFYNSIKNNGK